MGSEIRDLKYGSPKDTPPPQFYSLLFSHFYPSRDPSYKSLVALTLASLLSLQAPDGPYTSYPPRSLLGVWHFHLVSEGTFSLLLRRELTKLFFALHREQAPSNSPSVLFFCVVSRLRS